MDLLFEFVPALAAIGMTAARFRTHRTLACELIAGSAAVRTVGHKPMAPDAAPIAAGMVAARRFRWDALVDGEPVITAAVNWLMGEADLDTGWMFGERGERFEVEVTGDPDVRLVFKGLQPESITQGLQRNPGIVATANNCVNAIPYVCAAEPGIKTYLDLPLLAGRPLATLSKGVR